MHNLAYNNRAAKAEIRTNRSYNICNVAFCKESSGGADGIERMQVTFVTRRFSPFGRYPAVTVETAQPF